MNARIAVAENQSARAEGVAWFWHEMTSRVASGGLVGDAVEA